jgi:hypothetical protein
MMSEIEKYALKSQIPPEQSYHIQLTFEEIALLIVPNLENPKVDAVIEWSETQRSATIEIRYNGQASDVTAKADEIVKDVLRASASQIEHSYDETDELPNQIVVTIR